MTDWTDQLEAFTDRSRDQQKAQRLLRVLSREPGTDIEKLAFLEEHIALFEAEAAREGATGKRQGGAIVSLAIRYWKARLRRSGSSVAAEWKRIGEDFG